jgi:hypothetical protein
MSVGISSQGKPSGSRPVRCATISEIAITPGVTRIPTSEPVARKPSAKPRMRGGYMSAAATRNCCEAAIPMVNITMPRQTPTVLCQSMPSPDTIAPARASAWPKTMPGLRP